MIRLSASRYLFIFLAAVTALAGCIGARPSDTQTGGSDASARNETAQVIRLIEEIYVEEHTGQGILIDVRTPEEWAGGHLVDARHINVLADDFRARVDRLDRESTYYLYCRSGNRSRQAAQIMADMGFESLYNIGGFAELASAGADTTH